MMITRAGALVCAVIACGAASAGTHRQPPARPSPAIVWLVLVDDLHIDFRNTGRLHALLRTVATELFEDGDSMGILSGGGPSQVAGELTADRTVLEQEIPKLSGAGLKLSEIRASTDEGTSEVHYRMHIALSSAYNAIGRLRQLRDRRNVIIYVSNGYLFVSSPADIAAPRVANPFSVQGDRFSADHVRSEVAALIDEARRANVTIFAIDPRSMPGGLSVDPTVSAADSDSYVETTRNSLRVLSERTGGFAIMDEALVEGLRRINSMMRTTATP